MAAKYAAEWDFTCRDNGGKFQYFSVKANDKTEAIKKAFEKARKSAAGDIGYDWTCKLKRVLR